MLICFVKKSTKEQDD